MPTVLSRKLEEEDLLIPVLKIIEKYPGCTTDTIQSEIVKEMAFSPEDLAPSPTRGGEPMYKQIVRNLTGSHFDSNDFGKKYARREIIPPVKPKSNRYKYYLTEDGQKFLTDLALTGIVDLVDENDDDFEVKRAKSYDEDLDLSNINNREPELNDASHRNNRYKTDPRLAQSVLKKINYQCEYARLTGVNHPTFNARRGNYYLEAHHLIPMKAQKDFLPHNIDREENIIGLCPNCHSAVHYGTLEEKIKYLEPLYNDRIEKLKACGIDISFEDLVNKYYLK